MVNDRLPAAGCDLRDRTMVFRFYDVREDPSVPPNGCQCRDPNSNIFCDEFIDFKQMEEDCRHHNSLINELERNAERGRTRLRLRSQPPLGAYGDNMFIPPSQGQGGCHGYMPGPQGTCPMPNSRPLSCQCLYNQTCSAGHNGNPLEGLTYGHRRCPGPQGVQCSRPPPRLVGPGHIDLSDSRRPTGLPYFNHERSKSCPPTQAVLAAPSQFNYDQWLNTTNDRKAPDCLLPKCLGSLCTVCGPRYRECCRGHTNPDSYLLAKQVPF